MFEYKARVGCFQSCVDAFYRDFYFRGGVLTTVLRIVLL